MVAFGTSFQGKERTEVAGQKAVAASKLEEIP